MGQAIAIRGGRLDNLKHLPLLVHVGGACASASSLLHRVVCVATAPRTPLQLALPFISTHPHNDTTRTSAVDAVGRVGGASSLSCSKHPPRVRRMAAPAVHAARS